MTKPTWGGKALLDLYFMPRPSLRKVRELKQEPGEGTEAQTVEKCCSLACFQARAAHSGLGPRLTSVTNQDSLSTDSLQANLMWAVSQLRLALP